MDWRNSVKKVRKSLYFKLTLSNVHVNQNLIFVEWRNYFTWPLCLLTSVYIWNQLCTNSMCSVMNTLEVTIPWTLIACFYVQIFLILIHFYLHQDILILKGSNVKLLVREQLIKEEENKRSFCLLFIGVVEFDWG